MLKGKPRKDISGQTFNRLTVINHIIGSNVLCSCSCNGNIKVYDTQKVKSGHTKSCGCWNLEKIIERNTKHNQAVSGKVTRLFHIWSNMVVRCTSPNLRAYKHYGGRGIKVCDEWLNSENFFSWAKISGYNDNLTLERKDVNGNYCPENCEWVTWDIQADNKRCSRRFKFFEETLTINKIFNKYSHLISADVTKDTVRSRVANGYNIYQACFLPKNVKRRSVCQHSLI